MTTLTPEKEAVERLETALNAEHHPQSWPKVIVHADDIRTVLAAKEAAEKEVERLTRERDIALELHQDALRLAGTDVTEAYQIGRGLRPSPFESGWLIEGWDSRRNAFKAEWWSLDMPGTEDGHGWTKDSNLALRFGRERDAQDYINDIGWTEAKPTEHGWGKPVSALPPPVPTEEAEAKPCRHFWNTEAEPVKCALCNITRPTQAPQDVAGLVEEYLGEVTHWIGFSASAINCGEQWTPISEDRYQKVKQARDGLRKLFRPSPISHEDRPLELAAADNNRELVRRDKEELTDLISDAISDSLDLDWNSRDGARAVVAALVKDGIVEIKQ